MDTMQAAAQMLCPTCGNYSKTSDFCSNCSQPIAPRKIPVPGIAASTSALGDTELAGILTMLAITVLGGGLLVAMYVWVKYGTIASVGFFGQEASISNPIAKIGAFGIAANSVIWSALLEGVSRSLRNTVELRRKIGQLRAREETPQS